MASEVSKIAGRRMGREEGDVLGEEGRKKNRRAEEDCKEKRFFFQ